MTIDSYDVDIIVAFIDEMVKANGVSLTPSEMITYRKLVTA